MKQQQFEHILKVKERNTYLKFEIILKKSFLDFHSNFKTVTREILLLIIDTKDKF